MLNFFCTCKNFDPSLAFIEAPAEDEAMKFCEAAPFAMQLSPDAIMAAARTLSTDSDLEAEWR
jgi:hypothetical protein